MHTNTPQELTIAAQQQWTDVEVMENLSLAFYC